MYHLNISHIHQNDGGSEWAGGWGIQKTIKICHENNKISALTRPNNTLKKAMKFGVFLLCSLSVWLYCSEGTMGGAWEGGGGLNPIWGCFLLAKAR